VQLYAFDMLAGEEVDLRALPLSMRVNLARLLSRRPDGNSLRPSRGEIGPDLFRAPAPWAWRGWSRSAATAAIDLADRRAGSKNRRHPALDGVLKAFR
jgi:hypothetical protein